MTERTFASWVEPIATTFKQQGAELVDMVRSISAEAWSRPSPNEGWTYRDLLGHLATRDPRDLRLVLNAVISKSRLDPAQLTIEEDVPINEGLLEHVGDASVEEIVDRLEDNTGEILDLLSKLSEDDENRRQRDFPMSLAEALSQMPQHERMHLAQLRTALEG